MKSRPPGFPERSTTAGCVGTSPVDRSARTRRLRLARGRVFPPASTTRYPRVRPSRRHVQTQNTDIIRSLRTVGAQTMLLPCIVMRLLARANAATARRAQRTRVVCVRAITIIIIIIIIIVSIIVIVRTRDTRPAGARVRSVRDACNECVHSVRASRVPAVYRMRATQSMKLAHGIGRRSNVVRNNAE